MKRKYLVFNFVLFFLLLAGLVSAQNTPTLSYFRLTAGDGLVVLSWQLDAGVTCLGTQIERSVSGSEFEKIGEIGGICGDLTKPESYSFVDENPPGNLELKYRLELGTGVYSDTLELTFVDIGGNYYQVRPNPVNGISKIYFQSKEREQHQIQIFSSIGALVHQHQTNLEYFTIEGQYLNPGIYVFVIRSEKNDLVIKGKFLVR